MLAHDGHQRCIVQGEPREAVERPGLDERLRVLDVAARNRQHARALAARPFQEKQCAHDLEAQFPFVAVGEGTDEELIGTIGRVESSPKADYGTRPLQPQRRLAHHGGAQAAAGLFRRQAHEMLTALGAVSLSTDTANVP